MLFQEIFFSSQAGQRHIWTEEEDILVTKFFAEEINDVTQEGNKGPLHSKAF
jgi:hypothetical protein